VADLRQRTRTGDQASAEQDAGADARGHGEVDDVGVSLTGAEVRLADCCEVGVVGEGDRDAEAFGERVLHERVGPVGRQVRCVLQAAEPVVDPSRYTDDRVSDGLIGQHVAPPGP
jgi:hypothetical protein